MMVLHIDCCISSGHASRTRMLSDAYLRNLTERFPNSVIETEDLTLRPYPSLTASALARRDRLIKEGLKTNEALEPAQRFARADEIVISAPYWDLSFPSVLKTYIENIMINTITFTYENDIPKGLCRGKKLTYITTAGGYIGNMDFGFQYIDAIGKMLGIPQCVKICAEGLDINGNDVQSIIDNAVKKTLENS